MFETSVRDSPSPDRNSCVIVETFQSTGKIDKDRSREKCLIDTVAILKLTNVLEVTGCRCLCISEKFTSAQISWKKLIERRNLGIGNSSTYLREKILFQVEMENLYKVTRTIG